MRRITPPYQKYILVNKDKEEVVLPKHLGLETGQRFHIGYDGSLADALYLLTVVPNDSEVTGDWPTIEGLTGRWSGDRVSVVGSVNDESLYRYASVNYKNVSDLVRDGFTKLFGIEYEHSTVASQDIWKRTDLI